MRAGAVMVEPASWIRPEIEERRAQAGGGRGVDQVAVQQHGGADADGETVDGGDHRLRHLGQAADEIERGRRDALAVAAAGRLRRGAGNR